MSATIFIRICPLLITFCSLLLLISLSHRPVDAHGIEHKNPISKKSLSSWIQNYKEPKSSSTESAAHKNGQSASQKAAAAAEEEEEEEMTCTIKVQKVGTKWHKFVIFEFEFMSFRLRSTPANVYVFEAAVWPAKQTHIWTR